MVNLKLQQRAAFFVLMVICAPYTLAADIDAGKNKAAMCQGCHGAKGVSINPMWPSLAAQQPTYLESQMKAFKSGDRKNTIMKGIATALNTQDMENLAAYFSSQSAKSAGGDANLAKKGKSKVAVCMGCHGSNLQGRNTFPRLASQHSLYLAKQLNDFKNGVRVGGPMGAMAKGLSEEDIKEISAYLGTL